MPFKPIRFFVISVLIIAFLATLVAWYFIEIKSSSSCNLTKKQSWSPFYNIRNSKFNEFEEITAKIVKRYLENEKSLSPAQKSVLASHKEDVVSILILNAFFLMKHLNMEIRRDTAIENLDKIYQRLICGDAITFSGVEITRIPHEGFSFFHNVSYLIMKDCGIREGVERLVCLKKLFLLSLRGNKLRQIPNFRGFKNLKIVDLYGNKNLSMTDKMNLRLENIDLIMAGDTQITNEDKEKIIEMYPNMTVDMSLKDGGWPISGEYVKYKGVS